MNELTLEQIISLATNTANIVMSAHANKQCLKREINAEDILTERINNRTISNGLSFSELSYAGFYK